MNLLRYFRPTQNHQLVWRLLRESFRPHALSYTIAILAMLAVAAMTAASAWVMQDITDEFVIGKDINRIYKIAALVAGIFIAKGVATYVQGLFLSRVGNSIIASRQREVYDRILAQGIAFYHSVPSADLITRVTHNAQSARRVLDILVTSFFRDLFSVIGLLGVMVIKQPLLSLIALVVGPIAVFGVNLILRRVREIMAAEFLSLAQIIQVMQETMIGVRIVKSFNLESVMRSRMRSAVTDVENRANSIAALEAGTSPIMETLAGLAIAGAVVVSGFLVVQGNDTPGSIMAFITALLLVYEPAKRLARTRVALESGLVGVRRMFDLIDRPLTVVEKADAKPLTDGPGLIELKSVSFSYKRGNPVLQDVNLTFPPRKMTALVGPSGSGKSTIMNLVMRMYDPDKGGVFFDGHRISHVTLHSLRQRIAYVSQDTFLFDGSIMHNIRLGREGATEEDVIAAAKSANAHDFISAMPNGYDTEVGENGAFLSGGQKQRLSIARAILRDADILLLDEASSALDAESEALFREALVSLSRGRTTIAIAHRLSTVHQADNIVVINEGRVAEQGRHEDLVEQEGLYRKLYEHQLMR